jgi:hypothetical protein
MILWHVNNELERIWKEASVAESRYYPSIRLEGLREATKTQLGIEPEHLSNTSLEGNLGLCPLDN